MSYTAHGEVQASQVDMLIGSVANGLNATGGFCAGSDIVVKHQVCTTLDTPRFSR